MTAAVAEKADKKVKARPTGLVVGKYKCGFCQFPALNVPHDADGHCPGAIDCNGYVWVCPCGCKPLHCIKCKSRDAVDPETWTCIDVEACATAVAARVANDPTIRMIRELTERAHAREAAEAAARPRTPGAPAGPRPGAGICECGCGATTKSRFGMGHDARLRGQLQRDFAAGDAQAGLELAARGGIWATKAPGVTAPDDPEAFVAGRVAERLSSAGEG